MIHVFGYVRVSTAGQAKDGTGLEEKRAQIASYCQENAFKLTAIYEDAGISGAKVDEDDLTIDRPTYSIYNHDHDPSAFLVNGMMELLDQYEHLEITLKLRRGRHRKASKGGYSGGRPAIGYTVQRGAKVLHLDKEKVETVQRTFEPKFHKTRFSI
jgi:site-specific DNA recombinase